MKAMKLVMMAVFAVLMGSTLTSCLDSGDSRPYGYSWVTIQSSIYGDGISSVKSDDGYTFNILNPSFLKLGTGADAFYPERAFISYYLPEGTIVEEGKTEYDIEVNGATYYSLAIKDAELESIESKTDVNLELLGAGNNYIDVCFTTYMKEDAKNEDFKLILKQSEEKNTLSAEMINMVEVDNSSGQNTRHMISYKVPYKQSINSRYPDLEYLGQNQDSIYIKFINKMNGNSIEKFKIKVR